MFSTTDTIVAEATPPGRGGIGIVRLSGSDAHRVARALILHDGPLQPRYATFTRLRSHEQTASFGEAGPADRSHEPTASFGEAGPADRSHEPTASFGAAGRSHEPTASFGAAGRSHELTASFG